MNTLLYCLGNQKFWMLFCVLGGSENLNPLLCYLGDQKFWISSVVLGIRNSESSPVLLGNQKFWISCVVWGIRNSESSPVFWGDQKLWILSCVVWGIRNSESSPVSYFGGSEILNPLLCCLGIRNSESSPVLFWGDQKFWISPLCCLGESEILNVLLCFCRGWELVMNFRLSSLGIKKLESSPVFYGEPLRTRNFENPYLLKFEIQNRRLLGRILWFLTNRETFPVSF